jgi:hypothetical protein
MPIAELVGFLQDLAAKVKLKRFFKGDRQKKKHPHVSTARRLSGG